MKPYRPYFTIVYLIIFIGLTTKSILETDITMMIITGLLFCILWVYSFISNFLTEYKKESTKLIWTLALVLMPISAIFYDDIRETLKIENNV